MTTFNGSSHALVAGGAGFLGSHLCDVLLERGETVVCVDSFLTGRMDNIAHLENHPRFRLLRGDIIERNLGKFRIDTVFNLACAASPELYQADPEHTMMTNVVGTRNLLALAEKAGARFVQASTSEVYGNPLVHPQKESYLGNVNCTGPRACYDEGKRAAEALCFDYRRLHRVDTRVARIFNTYGPRMRADDGRVVSNLINQALAGKAMTVYGDGSQTRSFCYFDDLVRGLVALMDHEGDVPGPVNLGNPTEITVAELARTIRGLVGGRSHTVFRNLPVDDPKRRRPDISTARRLLGWEPTVSLAEGLGQTIAWFANERNPSRALEPTAQRAAASSF